MQDKAFLARRTGLGRPGHCLDGPRAGLGLIFCVTDGLRRAWASKFGLRRALAHIIGPCSALVQIDDETIVEKD